MFRKNCSQIYWKIAFDLKRVMHIHQNKMGLQNVGIDIYLRSPEFTDLDKCSKSYSLDGVLTTTFHINLMP